MPKLTKIVCEFDSGDLVQCKIDPNDENIFELKCLDSEDDFFWNLVGSWHPPVPKPFKLEIKALVVWFKNQKK